MDILLVVLAILCGLIGLVGAVVPALPGPPLSFMGLLFLHWSTYTSFSAGFLVLFCALTVAVTFADNLLPVWMAKRSGGSRLATRGSLIGLVVGLLFFPPLGLVLGAFIGAFAGELIYNRQDVSKAFRVACSSFVAFLLGTGAKLILSGVMLFYIVRSLF